MTTTTGGTQWGHKKDAYDYPSLEDFHPLVSYAITISPSAQMRSDSVTECVSNISADILPFFKNAEYVLRPEISTKSCILHYHGTLLFPCRDDITKFYFYLITKLKCLCTFTIRPISDFPVWDQYCKKQRLHMKPFLAEYNLRYKLTHSIKSIFVKQIKKKVPAEDDLGNVKQSTTSNFMTSHILSALKK